MSEKKTNSHDETKTQKQEGSKRRAFIKKAIYTTPVLVAMGQLAKPTSAQADDSRVDGRPWGQ